MLARSPRLVLPALVLSVALCAPGAPHEAALAESVRTVSSSSERICDTTPLDDSRGVRRIWGDDRYRTSIAVSRVRYGDRQGCEIQIASGRAFPDAITAAASPFSGPLLLIPGTSLPSSTRREIDRLDPVIIQTYGGDAVIAPEVTSQLSRLASAGITANGGANRYETAARATYSHRTRQVAYIAAGDDFPDALAATPLIRGTNGSLLLVQKDSIPAVTRDALRYLRPSSIVVLGGAGAVTARVERALRSYTSGSVTRISGEDRYSTAVTIADVLEPHGASQLTVVSGRSFADALSAARLWGGPILLVEPDGIPEVVREALLRHRPTSIIIVGGASAVSDSVRLDLEQYLRPEE